MCRKKIALRRGEFRALQIAVGFHTTKWRFHGLKTAVYMNCRQAIARKRTFVMRLIKKDSFGFPVDRPIDTTPTGTSQNAALQSENQNNTTNNG